MSARLVPGLRWWIAGLIFLATLINFLNRLVIAVLGPVITRDLHLSASQFAGLTTWFLAAYTISQLLSGRLYDRIGTKRGFTVSIVVWSLASMAHAAARGLFALDCFRFLLGAGEAGNWPGAAKVIAEWFPIRQRAFGMAIFNSGTSLGSVVATPLIIMMQRVVGWQNTFLVMGGLGFVWLALWQRYYQPPERHPLITPEEYALIQADRPVTKEPRATWGELLRHPQAWAILLARFFADPVWWLYITWLPLYLFNVRHFTLSKIAAFAWLPFVAADAGSLAGGWASGYLISRGWTVNRARKSVIVVGMLCMCVGMFAPAAQSSTVALALIAVVLFGFQSWINNVQTMPSDYFPENAVGSITGMGGMGAGIGAMLLIQGTGFVVDHFHSYTPILVLAGLLPVAATAVLFQLGGPIRRLTLQTETQ
ncbi:MAG TPA: MFS transporter [Candidatus Sulfopaludibacter sp.]|jgi:ACS family hexuronate transporter-like MFS transporter|nr:MFS transporter [Candidatus Sulfopaludibacter sp.]